SEGTYLDAEYLPYNSSFHNLGTAKTIYAYDDDPESLFTQYTLVSYMARLNYSYKDRYLITVANRWDGSSVLAEGHKWASFPSAAIGWRVSEEGFLRDVNLLDEL